MIRLVEVKTKKQLSEFIKFPDKLYSGNKYRVPQLHFFEKSALSRKKNPAFEFCEAKYWLAYKDGKLAGRIAGIINHKANEIWNEKTLRFGWIDFIDDTDVSAALINEVEQWAKQNGLTKVAGPLGFTDMDLEGMLVEGFDEISTQIAIYNYPYYPAHLEKHGYTKDVDWIQFEINLPDKIPDKVWRVSQLVRQKYDLKVLEVKKAKDLLPYAGKMFNLYNESLKDLYGFVPLSDRQIKYYTDQYFPVVNPKYTKFIVDKNNELVGFGFCFLSLSKALMKAKGSLFPFGFMHIYKALQKNDTVDLIIQAIKPEYKAKGVPALFYAEIIKAFIENGIKTAISSSVLEYNKKSFLLFTNGYEKHHHMTRRAYKKDL
ncbi:MAG TPA: N-acetyltransferase [Bacteroidales bacterium]|mgnify:CR=1 FL=1|nr:N-acetyltransferase [Bacteroidales bacterium]